ncbi:MAG: hypothetical protein A2060_07635 [Planctomycetes bacterium GWA2_50_13]|nr:MAG: hypothetical protein A2060_07635 [Planctomycetes bacterium GWA2_50_13]OHB95066.1 MAG: hypothetical protein A3I59_00140 [Planctomycetes bacterium RIFCSPLOWO2_02_FULL_50_16]HCN18855.1 hypothetical protein [Planctomycetia bacterium]
MGISRFWLFILIVSNTFFFLLGFFVGTKFTYAAEYLQGFRTALLVITAITLAVGGYKLYNKYMK